MSRSLERKGWTALVVASAFSSLAFLGIPRAGKRPERAPLEHAREPNDDIDLARVRSGALGARRARAATERDPGSLAPPTAGAPLEPVRRAPARHTAVSDPAAAVRDALALPARGTSSLALADGLVALGPGALPEILRGLLDPVAAADVPDDRAGALERLRRDALLDAWGRFDASARIAALRLALDPPDPDRLRLLAGLAGQTEDGDAARLLLELAGKLDELQLARPYIAEPIETALVRTLPRALESGVTARSLRELNGRLAEIAGRAALRSQVRTGVAAGCTLLGRDPALDVALLSTLARRDIPARALLAGRELEILRERTSAREPEVRRAACAALGNAGDTGALEALVACLDDVDPLVGAAARGALRNVTGKDRGMTSEDWAASLAERDAWLAGEARKLEELALGGEPDACMTAIDRLLERVDARHLWIDLLRGCLDSDCPKVVRRAAAGLRRIGTADALQRLDDALSLATGVRLRLLEQTEG